jgi:ribonuclease P protein component
VISVAGPRSFQKALRLRRRRQFLAIQREGSRRHTAHLVFVRRRGETELPRLGVTVSARVGNSVQRNRIKRLLREVFRHRRSELAPIDLVVIAKTGAGELTYDQAAREFSEALGLVARSH